VLYDQLSLYFQTIRMDHFPKGTSLSVPGTSKIIHKAANRKYDDAYIQLGFTCFEQEYPALVIEVLKTIIPFASTYLCESAFSVMTAIKTKYRNRVKVENDLRLCPTKLEPDLKQLCEERQAYPSH
jgi:hypothetical protein